MTAARESQNLYSNSECESECDWVRLSEIAEEQHELWWCTCTLIQTFDLLYHRGASVVFLIGGGEGAMIRMLVSRYCQTPVWVVLVSSRAVYSVGYRFCIPTLSPICVLPYLSVGYGSMFGIFDFDTTQTPHLGSLHRQQKLNLQQKNTILQITKHVLLTSYQ